MVISSNMSSCDLHTPQSISSSSQRGVIIQYGGGEEEEGEGEGAAEGCKIASSSSSLPPCPSPAHFGATPARHLKPEVKIESFPGQRTQVAISDLALTFAVLSQSWGHDPP